MARLFRKMTQEPAQPPGTLDVTGRTAEGPAVITVIDFKGDHFEERTVADVAECLAFRDTDTTTWINIDGVHDLDILRAVADHFGIHPLVQEDIVNTHQRPKVEDFDSYMFIVMHMLTAGDDPFEVRSEQLSMILAPNIVISFQTQPGDVFDPVRARLRVGKGRIRNWGADYLAYVLLDAVVDHYFLILEKAGELIEEVEAELLEAPDPSHLQVVHHYKREMILMRRTVWPLREMIGGLARAESDLIQERVSPFLRDVYDHTIQVAESVEIFRDMLMGLQDLYLSSISNKTNEVMKVLTIAATIFVPLTFVAGIYGMNFEGMPELNWKWSYPTFWVVTVAAAGGMIAFFRRRKFL